MLISLIITTYNRQEALCLSLQSACVQTLLPLEIVVADDGSGPETAELVRRIGESAPVPIVHSWQKDKGFRSSRSRNKAIARARGDYIILIDGDMVLEPHFIEDHQAWARPGFFVQGTRALLGAGLSARVLREGCSRVSFFARGVANRKNCLRSVLLAQLFSFESRKLNGVKTCNFAFWKEDALKVNGFNEGFIGWGREDSEFAARLLNAGIRRQDLKFKALGYHLYHPEHTRDRLAINDGILEATIKKKLQWCEQGIDQHLV